MLLCPISDRCIMKIHPNTTRMCPLDKIIIDFPFAVEDLDQLFDIVDLLENRAELIDEFKPEVQKYLVRKTFFTGPFRKAYDDAFDELIVRLIKGQIVKHFPQMNPEQILALCDKDFLKIITDDYYFNPDNYITKDGNNESTNPLQ